MAVRGCIFILIPFTFFIIFVVIGSAGLACTRLVLKISLKTVVTSFNRIMTVTQLAAATRWLVHRLVVLAVSAGYDEHNGVRIFLSLQLNFIET